MLSTLREVVAEFKTEEVRSQLVVVGGGPAGVCAALSAARLGMEVILVGNRPVLGGNSSSEVRVWTRGATGGGNLFSEEMGVWGVLKLENLYRNFEANPVFWDEVLLDGLLAYDNLKLFLNTEVISAVKDGKNIKKLYGVQLGTERRLAFTADYYIDATGDGTIGALTGHSFFIGRKRRTIDDESKDNEGTLGHSILYYTKKTNRTIPFKAPRYAYSMEKIESILGRGGRIIDEKMSGSDCWWFEYGGLRDTLGESQEIGLELKKLAMGVWNYIKNSKKFPADEYTLEWIGSLAGKRESRRMETEYLLCTEDILNKKRHMDAAFYGGWFIDSHPSGGIHDGEEENCHQIPVGVYQIPLRSLYHRNIGNLIFAGRDIGTEREAFFSSRIMNTCALSGQAAASMVRICAEKKKTPFELDRTDIRDVQNILLREDMFIPDLEYRDEKELVQYASVSAESSHQAQAGKIESYMSLYEGSFITFPAIKDNIHIPLSAREETGLKVKLFISDIPSRYCLGEETEELEFQLPKGETVLILSLKEEWENHFVSLYVTEAQDVSVGICESLRTGFVCGHRDKAVYAEPAVYYNSRKAFGLYAADNVKSPYTRPWGKPQQWCAAQEGVTWIKLHWESAVKVGEIRLYLDPDLMMELPSSHPDEWADSHLFAARKEMPPKLIKSFQISCETDEGEKCMIYAEKNNYQRLVIIRLKEAVYCKELCIECGETWGGIAAIYGIRIYERTI